MLKLLPFILDVRESNSILVHFINTLVRTGTGNKVPTVTNFSPKSQKLQNKLYFWWDIEIKESSLLIV